MITVHHMPSDDVELRISKDLVVEIIRQLAPALHECADDIATLANIDGPEPEDEYDRDAAVRNLTDVLNNAYLYHTKRELKKLAAEIFDATGTTSTQYERRPF